MSIARHHAEWLSLVEVSGPFLSMPVLLKVFPQGLDAHDSDHLRMLRVAYEEWEDHQADPRFHQAWVRFVLTQTLELPEAKLAEGQKIPQPLNVPVGEHGEILKPDLVLMEGDKPRLLIHVLPAGQDLEKSIPGHHWKASPDTRMMELLHGTGCRLGLVTNGERWMLVDAPRGETTAFASWYASYWLEEKITLQACRSLLCGRRFFGVPAGETLEDMLTESASNQQEVTDQLGYQVRKAVEVLIQSLDRADQDHGRKLLADDVVNEEELYRAALTVMMRLVFLFSAEERGLLLLGDPLYDQHYAVSTLRAQLREAADQHGEEVLERRLDAWCRLLTTFRAVYSGAWHEKLKLPAYGSRLFNPDEFPFLEGRPARDTPLPVNNRTVLHLLEALQILQVKVPGGGPAEARRLSFRALDIEQIGHVYEGLLDHTAKRAKEPCLGLLGTKDKEPEVALAELERLRKKGEDDLLGYLMEETGKSEPALKKALAVTVEGLEVGRFKAACGNDDKLWQRVQPFVGLVRRDTFDYPVVIPSGSVYVTEGTDRRTSGTHYTPKSLTEPIVQYTLEPLVYIGPAEGKPKEEWKLRSPRELLNLRICDMATGSGAFLVQACRYLAERLLEAWEVAEGQVGGRRQGRLEFSPPQSVPATPGKRPGITPFGDPATGQLHEQLIPTDPDERMIYARRLIAQRCLFGVDKNPLAVEMAKLSLWLLTMAKDLPFTFLDHAIRCGDSLVGIHDLDQLRYFDLRGKIENPRYSLDSLPPAIEKAIKLRRAIEEKTIHSVEDVREQERLLAEAEEQTRRLRIAADLLMTEGFGLGQAGFVCLANHFKKADLDTFAKEAERITGGRLTFHWPLEFPEVFEGRGGFDAIVGNPPFMGGRMIGRSLGEEYHSYLSLIRNGIKGSPDLCAYFLLRAFSLLRQECTFGLLATKSIAETGSRIVCLEQLLTLGARIFSAQSRRQWPGSASVVVAVVHVIKGKWNGPICLDGTSVSSIGSGLDASLPDVRPNKLAALRGMYSQGQDTLGRGFELSEEERNELYAADPNGTVDLFVVARYGH